MAKISLSKEKALTIINQLPFYWLFSGFLLISNGQTFLAYFLILATLANLTIKVGKPKTISKKAIILPITIYSISVLVGYLYNGEMWPTIRSTLYVLPFLFTTRIRYQDISKVLNFIVPISSIAIAIMFFGEHLSDNKRFVDFAGLNPIPLSTILVFYTCFSVSNLANSKHLIQSVIALCANCYSILMTETRTAYIVLLVIIVLFILQVLTRKKDLKKIAYVTIGFLLIGFLSFKFNLLPDSVDKRISDTKNEIALIKKKQLNTSIGVRLQIWSMSLDVIKSNYYIFPYKENQVNNYIESNNKKLTSAFYTYYISTHNQFLHSWMKSGLLGLISVIILVSYPSIYCVKRYGLKRSSLLILVSLSVSLFCLTENPLTQIATLQCYLMMLGLGYLYATKKPGYRQ
ncbi:O-antigen ligase family protein [Vibrio mediterranei]|uniref:O-antigen ligase family protein n=1 Tax=Vibrio mediterranei TaxID=689 RepID=UPI004068C6EE